jgi:hypothetical protein
MKDVVNKDINQWAFGGCVSIRIHNIAIINDDVPEIGGQRDKETEACCSMHAA